MTRLKTATRETTLALEKPLISLLGLKESSSKYDLRCFDVKLYRMAAKLGGKSEIFALNYGGAVGSGASDNAG